MKELINFKLHSCVLPPSLPLSLPRAHDRTDDGRECLGAEMDDGGMDHQWTAEAHSRRSLDFSLRRDDGNSVDDDAAKNSSL
jgi:hypothetical protein